MPVIVMYVANFRFIWMYYRNNEIMIINLVERSIFLIVHCEFLFKFYLLPVVKYIFHYAINRTGLFEVYVFMRFMNTIFYTENKFLFSKKLRQMSLWSFLRYRHTKRNLQCVNALVDVKLVVLNYFDISAYHSSWPHLVNFLRCLAFLNKSVNSNQTGYLKNATLITSWLCTYNNII